MADLEQLGVKDGPPWTLERLAKRIQEIDEAVLERAYSLEDNLIVEVVAAIANGNHICTAKEMAEGLCEVWEILYPCS